MYYIQYCFFISGGAADDVLVRLSLIEQAIKDGNLMCIPFNVKHPQNMSRTISNMYTYPFNPQLVIKTSAITLSNISHDKKQKDHLYGTFQGTFICELLFFKWMGVFQS